MRTPGWMVRAGGQLARKTTSAAAGIDPAAGGSATSAGARLSGLRLPPVRLSDIRLPEVRLPEIRLPSARLPRVRLPGARLTGARGTTARAVPRFSPARRGTGGARAGGGTGPLPPRRHGRPSAAGAVTATRHRATASSTHTPAAASQQAAGAVSAHADASVRAAGTAVPRARASDRARAASAASARARAAAAAARMGVTAMGLPRGPHPVRVDRDLPVPMPDGVTLLADRYFPADRAHGGPPPVILMRSPYGRRGWVGIAYGYFFAQHGFQAVLQSVRGTFGSGGVFDPLGNERGDGVATAQWLKAQPWFGGVFAMHGPSYLGYAQWAMAAEAGPELRAMAAQVCASQFHDAAYVGGAFALESTLTWSDLTSRIERPITGMAAAVTSVRRARQATLSGRPLSELDMLSAGVPLPFFQDLLRNSATDGPYWRLRDHSATVPDVEAPVSFLGGWYDVFLPWQLQDYARLRQAGRRPRLTIGPWFHTDPRQLRAAGEDALSWFRAHLADGPAATAGRRPGGETAPDQPVRLYVTGAGEWRHYPDWPVPGVRDQPWHLHPARGLAPAAPLPSPPDIYRYDPAHPTPAMRGPTLIGNCEPEDNRRLEARKDVLTFTSASLPAGLEIIGPVAADLFARSNRAHTDFVVRLCDVGPTGASVSVCEGVRRLTAGNPAPGADGVRRVRVDLWPAGHRFLPGHRLRVQVASGAYPRVDRNPGTGEPAGPSGMLAADQEIFHDPGRPSAIWLPVVS